MRPGINALGHKVRRYSDKRIAKSEPPAAAAMKPFSKSPLRQGRGPGPGAHFGAPPFPPGPLQAAGPDPLWSARLRAVGPLFLRTPRPLLRRGPCPCAGPLRRGAPAAASRPRSGFLRPRFARRGRAPGVPPGSPARAVCAAARLRGLSLPPLRLGSPSARCGLPPLRSGRPCSAPCSPLRFAWARRVPPCPSAVASVAWRLRCCAPSRLRSARLLLRLGGFGPGGFRPRGLRGLRPLVSACRPRGLAARRACAACFLRRGFPSVLGASGSALLGFRFAAPWRAASLSVGGFAPASLPSLPPPPGARGKREASGLGAPAPDLRSSPLVDSASVGLDNRSVLWYFIYARPVPLLRGLPLSGYPRTAGKPLGRLTRRLFSLPCLSSQTRQNHRSDFPEVNRIYGHRCAFSR